MSHEEKIEAWEKELRRRDMLVTEARRLCRRLAPDAPYSMPKEPKVRRVLEKASRRYERRLADLMGRELFGSNL